MTEPTITCPNCHAEIRLTESLAAPLVAATRKQFEQQLAQKDEDVAKRQQELQQKETQLAESKRTLNDQIAERVASQLNVERGVIAADEAKKARLALETDLSSKDRLISDLNQAIKSLNDKLTTAQKAETDLLRKQRELDDAKRELDLTVEKRVQDTMSTMEASVRQRIEEETRLKMAEKDKLITDAQRQVEEMKRKMEQGSQQLQGEVQELELESLLRAKFPSDTIEPVPKGEHGGDVLHRIVSSTGQACGSILWESKRTKNWSDGWLSKLREDQRAAKAELAVIVSLTLPKDISSFDLVDGVWVTNSRSAIAVAIALRHSLIEITTARQAGEGQQTKMGLVYQYLTGPRFRHRVEAIVEKFTDMHDDLDRERKTMTRLWAKREEQIRGVIDATAGMYGDLQGIAGKTLQEIEGLSLSALLAPHDDKEGV